VNARPLRRPSLSLYPKAGNNNPAAAEGGLAVIRSSRLALLALLSHAAFTPASAEPPGITDTEIKFGNIMPYSGPASALSVVGKAFAGYFDMVNEKGGINGRKLNMISLDDGFSPPKTVEATRRLVENDNVAFMFGTMGTAPSSATAKYLNGAKVPHLFLISSASKWNDPATQPWLMALPWAPNYFEEAGIDVRYALSKNPNAKFAILYQNDDAGKDYLAGVKKALGTEADKAIAMASSFEVADPTVDSQILTLANTKADVFLIYSVTPRACAQAIRKAHETGWRPMRFISSGCANKETVMVPAGLEAASGIMSVGALKPYSADSKDADLVAYRDFMKARVPNVDPANFAAGYAYMVAQALVVVLQQCKNDLSRENIMAQAANLKNVSLPLLMPGVKLNTSATDYRPIKDGYMVEFRELLRGS
jgi:ABC-type branched-subunit amino acid transport system substrate-binding protein